MPVEPRPVAQQAQLSNAKAMSSLQKFSETALPLPSPPGAHILNRNSSCSGPLYGLRDTFGEQKALDTHSTCLIAQGFALNKKH